jgi:transposase
MTPTLRRNGRKSRDQLRELAKTCLAELEAIPDEQLSTRARLRFKVIRCLAEGCGRDQAAREADVSRTTVTKITTELRAGDLSALCGQKEPILSLRMNGVPSEVVTQWEAGYSVNELAVMHDLSEISVRRIVRDYDEILLRPSKGRPAERKFWYASLAFWRKGLAAMDRASEVSPDGG